MTSSSSACSSEDTKLIHSNFVRTHLVHLDLSEHVQFKEKKVVASGAYSDISIHSCSLPNRGRTQVAVKRLRLYTDQDLATLFEKEIYVWSKLHHPNVLPLLGFAFDKNTGYPLLVSEWMENQSVWKYVRAHRECDLLRLIIGIVEGLVYLHRQKVVHSDIKPANILVSDSGDALITDFGCARIVDASLSLANPSSGSKGTIRYMAYELLAIGSGSTSYTDKSDVWAFGMTLYQLFSLQRPYEPLEERQVPLAIVHHELLPLRPAPCPWELLGSEEQDLLWRICESCWRRDPSSRPSMQSILDALLAPRGVQSGTRAVVQRRHWQSRWWSYTTSVLQRMRRRCSNSKPSRSIPESWNPSLSSSSRKVHSLDC